MTQDVTRFGGIVDDALSPELNMIVTDKPYYDQYLQYAALTFPNVKGSIVSLGWLQKTVGMALEQGLVEPCPLEPFLLPEHK